MGLFDPKKKPKYKKQVKHKRGPNRERDAFSKNQEKTVYTYGNNDVTKVDVLSGRQHHYSGKTGREIKRPGRR